MRLCLTTNYLELMFDLLKRDRLARDRGFGVSQHLERKLIHGREAARFKVCTRQRENGCQPRLESCRLKQASCSVV